MKRSLALVAATAMWWSALATAGGHKVLVLPVDGDADPAVRKQLTTLVVSLAKSEGGTVATGNTTFAETSAAIGCDAQDAACGEQVRAGLNVDELVYGTAQTINGQVVAVISKVEKGQTKQDQTVTLAAHQKAETAEATLKPLFGGEPLPVAGSGSGSASGTGSASVSASGSASEPGAGSASESGSGSGAGSGAGSSAGSELARDTFFASDDHKIGVGLAAGGGLLFVIGVALWASESGLQDNINNAPTSTSADIAALRDLEDRASTKAWEGNILVIAGLAAAGVGTYFLLRDHEVQATVAPVDHATGAAVVLGGRW